jgi:hypothetical protein
MNLEILQKTIPKPIIMFFYSMIFMLALISTSGFINIILPSPQYPENLGDITTKFEYFAKHKDDYDVIFLGPSTTYQGVIPKVFDETMAANGKTIKSFNFGIMAANAAEIDFYLQKILALKPANLKWVFLDCVVDSFLEIAPTSAKNVYWHTPLKTLENFRLITESSLSLKEKINGVYANSISFLYRWLGIGSFSNAWQQIEDKLPSYGLQQIVSSDQLIKEAGYYSMDWMKNSDEWKKNFESNYLDIYKRRLKEAKLETNEQANASTVSINTYGIKIIKKIISRLNESEYINQNKVETIFFIPPILDSDADHYSIKKAYDLGYISTLFALNNPNTFATLYELERRADGRHLNHQGAEEFTIILATEFSKHLNLSQNGIYQQSPISISPN